MPLALTEGQEAGDEPTLRAGLSPRVCKCFRPQMAECHRSLTVPHKLQGCRHTGGCVYGVCRHVRTTQVPELTREQVVLWM